MDTSDIMTSNNFHLSLPEIGKNLKRNRKPEVLHLESDEVEHRLEDFVRLQYLKYVEGVLQENYHLWLKSEIGQMSELNVTYEQIRKTAENIEADAVRACMVVSLYRKAIIKMVKVA